MECNRWVFLHQSLNFAELSLSSAKIFYISRFTYYSKAWFPYDLKRVWDVCDHDRRPVWKHFFPASAMICDMSSGRSEELNLVQLSRPLRRCRLRQFRALEKMGGETSQLALARCVMRGVLGRERSRGRTVEKWRVKTKFCSTYKVHCYGWTVRHFSLPIGSGHLYTIFKLSVLNNRIIESQIEGNIYEIN